MDCILKTSSLTKIYSGVKAVNKVNMHVKKGAIYGLIGKNGAGKTTLLKMILGLSSPNEGEIELFGSKELSNHRRRIGSIVEYPSVYPYMSAYDNLRLQQKMLGIPDKDCIKKILKIVGLEDAGKKAAKKFSLGMKQRLGIAIALLGNPDVLILDEPTNGLDPVGIKEMRELLTSLSRENDVTIIISSHILGELSKVATCYGIMNKGSLVDEFSAEELESRCKRCLKIKVKNVKAAITVLETIIKTEQYDVLDDNTIRLFDYLDQPSYINGELIKNGIDVESITTAGQDLEGYFMELMGGKQDE